MRNPGTSHLRPLILLASGFFGVNFGLAIYQSTYTNFLVHDLNINALQIGALESIRELPGLLTALILGSILHFSQPPLAGFFIIVFSLGLVGVSTVNSWIQVVLWSFLWSVGFHSWTPLSSSITLGLSEAGGEGRRLGKLNSVSSIAAIIAMASVSAFSSMFKMRYRLFFIIAGLVPLIGGLMVFKIPSTAKPLAKTRIVFKRRYGVYYVLSFFEGARRQMFLTFAPFALVRTYGLDVTTIALIMTISRVLTFMTSPYLGKLVDEFGARRMLIASYILMIGDFLGYAYIRNIIVLLLLYVLNSILMVISRVSRITYINEISTLPDLTPSLAMGQTIEHVAAVILPLAGGIIWGIFGYEVTFLMGVACATCLLFTAQKIQRRR